MSVWIRVALLTIGGALGTNARYWLSVWVSARAGTGFPVATLVINLLGSFAAGLLAGVLARALPHPYWRILVLVGFLGGFTTFSAFELESLELIRQGSWPAAMGNLVGSVAAGLLAVALGAWISQTVIEPALPTIRPLAEPTKGAD